MPKLKVESYNQASAMPTQKVAATGIAGSLSVVLMYVLGLFDINPPAEVVAAVTTLVSFAAGYLVKEKRVVEKP